MGHLPVHIEQLPALHLASVSVTSRSPEETSINQLLAWARTHNLLNDSYRLFGYDNCKPHPDHTYTAWLTVDEAVESSGDITVQDFEGGLYATLEIEGLEQISTGWESLVKWCKHSDYSFGSQQGLEEHLSLFANIPLNQMRFKLYLSIEA